jgi:hypothetical protein
MQHLYNAFMPRSSIAPLYWILFVACAILAILLNLRWPGLPEQDPSTLLRDNWFLWGFNYFGVLLMPMAVLLIDDARHKHMRWPLYVVPLFVVGILALSVYMARRPANDLVTRDTPRILKLRWVWWLLLIALAAVTIFFIPRGSLDQLIDTMRKNLGLAFMWLDVVLNHIVALPLAQADMQRRGVANQTPWLIGIALTGPVALCLYMATRPASPLPTRDG